MSIHGEVNSVIRTRFRTAQTMSLSGVGHWHNLGEKHCDNPQEQECFGTDPLDLLRQELHYALDEVSVVQLHTHEAFYNENGICSMCGWDGNA